MRIPDLWDAAQKVLDNWHSALIVCIVGLVLIYVFYLNTKKVWVELRDKKHSARVSKLATVVSGKLEIIKPRSGTPLVLEKWRIASLLETKDQKYLPKVISELERAGSIRKTPDGRNWLF